MNPQELIVEVLEHIRGMWRFRWWAAGVAWAISVAGWFYVCSLPDVYQASAKVFVDTNSLLRPLMEGLTAQRNPLDEVQVVSRAVLSRPYLEQVAHDTDLSLRATTREELEAIVTGLQRRIKVSGGGRDQIFTIEYSDQSRAMATDVVAAILERFVENALGNQGEDTQMTERALASEIRAHEERLLEAEAKLARFKTDNLGYMPDERGGYHDRLQTVLAAAARTEEQIRLVNERRGELSRQIEGEEPVFGIMPMASLGPSAGSCSQSGHIAEAEAQLSQYSVRYTERHPRILALQESIDELKKQCDEELASAARLGLASSLGASQPLETNPVYQNLRIQLSNADVELAELRAELRSYEDTIEQLRRDVDKIAQVETELKQLNRDYDVVQARHQELLRRWESLQAKNRLDPVTEQIQFRTIEPPFALAQPIAPNRPLLLAAAFVFALGAGAAVAFSMNQVNPAFFTRRSLARATEFPVLGSVSMILSPELLRSRRTGAIAWGATYVVLLIAAVSVIMFAEPASILLREMLQGVSP